METGGRGSELLSPAFTPRCWLRRRESGPWRGLRPPRRRLAASARRRPRRGRVELRLWGDAPHPLAELYRQGANRAAGWRRLQRRDELGLSGVAPKQMAPVEQFAYALEFAMLSGLFQG